MWGLTPAQLLNPEASSRRHISKAPFLVFGGLGALLQQLPAGRAWRLDVRNRKIFLVGKSWTRKQAFASRAPRYGLELYELRTLGLKASDAPMATHVARKPATGREPGPLCPTMSYVLLLPQVRCPPRHPIHWARASRLCNAGAFSAEACARRSRSATSACSG